MKLRTKTIMTIAATMICLIVALNIVSAVILSNSFAKLEERYVWQNVRRVLGAMEEQSAALDTSATDWANWDDTYEFVHTRYQDFVSSNIVDSTYINLRINVLLITDLSGEIVFGRGYDLNAQKETPIPESLMALITAGSPLVNHTGPDTGLAGILMLDEGPMLMASRPVLTSDETGPIRGSLIMGRFLGSKQIQHLGDTVLLPVSIRQVDEDLLPADFSDAGKVLLHSGTDQIHIRTLTDEKVAGYALFDGIEGRPEFIVKVDMPRDIYQQGRAAANYLSYALALAGLTFGVVLILLLRSQVLNRVAFLSESVVNIGAEENLSARVHLPGNDELSNLAKSINGMLRALDGSQEALRESEERYRTLFESATDAILIVDEWRVPQSNNAALEMFGCSRERMAEETIFLRFPETQPNGQNSHEWAVELAQMIHKGQSRQVEWQLRRGNGELFDAHVALSPFTISDRPCMLAIVRDVTRKRQAERTLRTAYRQLETNAQELEAAYHQIWASEQELAESETKYRELVENANSIIMRVDREGNVTFFNEFAETFFGYDEKEIVGRNVVGTIVPETDESGRDLRKMVTEICANPEQYNATNENENMRRNGERVWISWTNKLVRDEDGNVSEILCIGQDATARKKTERELAKTQRLFLAAIEQSPAGILIADAPDVRIRLANSAALGIRGDTSDQLMDIPVDLHQQNWQTFHPDGSPFDPEELPLSRAVLEGIVSSNVDIVIRRADGENRRVIANAAPVRDETGNVVAGVVMFLDVTERTKSLEEKERLATAIEQADETIMITDSEGTIQYVNPAFERVTGYSRHEAVGRDPAMLKSGRHSETFYRKMWETLKEGRAWAGHLINRKDDGTIFEEEATISPVRNPAGDTTHYVAVKRDVTRMKRLEVQLRQAQKMEAIGTLAGGIAHDFNNLLAPILGYSELVRAEFPEGGKTFDKLTHIMEAGERARDLVSQILMFSRQTERERKPLHLGPLVSECLKLLRGSLPSTIEIDQDIDTKSPQVLVDATQMHQVLMNLCTNAYHAMETDGGTLSVKLSHTTVTPLHTRGYLDLAPGEYVCIAVADTGIGMDAEIKQRIFEPYFTTKPEGKGTGLGLATIHGIVKSRGGAIRVYSEVGRGSEFKVYLPALIGEDGVQDVTADPPHRGDGQHVMIVDDEKTVLGFTKHAIRSLGYKVAAFSCPVEALDKFREAPSKFDMLITDHTMPKMTGIELVHQLTALRPDMPAVLLTGLSDDRTRKAARAVGIDTVLSKPVSLKKLGRALHKVFEKSRDEL